MTFAATWMDLETMILSEVSQTEKDKQYMTSLICGTQCFLKNETTELTNQTYRY